MTANRRPPRYTMNEKYGDGSAHSACDKCGLCKTCNDCKCDPTLEDFGVVGHTVMGPCPFCQHVPDMKNLLDSLHPRAVEGWQFGCVDNEGGCNATVWGDTPQRCVDLWNAASSRKTPLFPLEVFQVHGDGGERDLDPPVVGYCSTRAKADELAKGKGWWGQPGRITRKTALEINGLIYVLVQPSPIKLDEDLK